MNPLALVSLSAFLVFISIAIFIWFRKPTSAVSRVFAVSCTFAAYWSFAEFGYREADTFETAYLWLKITSFWPLVLAIVLHFTLAFTAPSKLLKNRLTYVLLYVPASVFSFMGLTTDLITLGPVKASWGWTYAYEARFVVDVVFLWSMAIAVLATYFCWHYYFTTVEPQKRQQAKYVAIGISLAMVLGWLISEVLLPWLKVDFPGLGMPAFAIGSIFIVYAIWKQGFLPVTPTIAAEKIVSTMSEFLFLVNQRGEIVRANQAALRALGYEEKELMGREIKTIFTEDIIKDALLEESRLAGQPMTGARKIIEASIKTKTGRGIPVALSVATIYDEDSKMAGSLYIARDITERKQMKRKTEELYRKEKDLRQSLEEEMNRRVEFTRALVHELKTPITPILATSGLLVDELKEEPLLKLARNIQTSAYQMNSRIDTLLDLTRGELGVLELNYSQIDPVQLISRVADKMLPVAHDRGLSLVFEVSPSLPSVWADENRLEQVILNLLTNAFKWSSRGGKVTLRAREKEATLVVEVQDTGPGIAKEDHQKIFEIYYRVESDRQRLEGLGLGLALCKTIVESHEGKIWVDSEKGRGSTFVFSVPLRADVDEI